MASSNPKYFPKVLSPNAIRWDVRASIYEFGSTQFSAQQQLSVVGFSVCVLSPENVVFI
jgi:hypothetical protein